LQTSDWTDRLDRAVAAAGHIGTAVKHPGVINIARASMSVANILTSGSLYDDSDVLDDREWVSIFSRRYSAFLVELLSPYVTSRIPVSTDGKHRLYVVRRGDIE